MLYYGSIAIDKMLVAMTVTGNTLIIMYMSVFHLQLRSGGYTVVMLMAVVEGYIADKPMGVAKFYGFFTGHARQAMSMFVVDCCFSAEAVIMDVMQHTYHLSVWGLF